MSFSKLYLHHLAFFFSLCMMGFTAFLRNTWIRAGYRVHDVRLARGVIIRTHSPYSIDIGRGVEVGLGTILLATSEMSSFPPEHSRLLIGEATAINEYCNLRASGGTIKIGSKCLLAQFVTVVASNHGAELGHPMIDQKWAVTPHSVEIGNDVWIGAGVTILPGSRIGSGAIIAAGAVVRGEIPGEEIWGGVPARFLKVRKATAIDSALTPASTSKVLNK